MASPKDFAFKRSRRQDIDSFLPIINEVKTSSVEGSVSPNLVGRFEELPAESDDAIPNNIRLSKLWKMLEFQSPGPQNEMSHKKNRLRRRRDFKGSDSSVASKRCDCLKPLCPGCFFPCPKCKSNKCGLVCRVNRDWTYGEAWVDAAQDTSVEK